MLPLNVIFPGFVCVFECVCMCVCVCVCASCVCVFVHVCDSKEKFHSTGNCVDCQTLN